AYTPGLTVTEVTTVRRRRLLPIVGEVLVREGQSVKADDVVAQTFMPGDIEPMNVANLLSVPPADVAECMLKKESEHVQAGEVIARTKGLFGMFKSEARSKVSGTVENISVVTGQVMIRGAPLPVQVRAYLSGRVVEVIPNEGAVVEATVSFVQGIFGVGGESSGVVRMACSRPDEPLTPEKITPEMKAAVVIGGARVTADAVKRAVQVGAAAVVTGGIDDQDLRDFLGYDLGVAITGAEKLGTTLVITEGFGDIAMSERAFKLFRSRAGSAASVNGATQIRAGVIRPEVLIPVVDAAAEQSKIKPAMSGMDIGSPVRVIREPYFGRIGKVAGLPVDPAVLESGSRARVVQVVFSDGEAATIPRANVELIEG
ncbi:MAG TPA: hypothetical protein VGM03_08645, partial [Phycisphaerae bacterium]